MSPEPTIRPAAVADLPAMFDLLFEAEVGGESDPPPRPALPPDYAHILATGALLVAEQGGEIVGYAGTIVRGGVAFLTDLFVRGRLQSRGIGAQLLRRAMMPHGALVRCTVSSTDVRALALYARFGMRPQWPNLLLRADASQLRPLSAGDVEVDVGRPGDPQLVAWDAAVGGRERPEDHAFWVEREGGVPLWLRRGDEILGYCYARLRAGTIWHPEAARIGPLGVRDAADAAVCAAAAVAWAAERAPVLRIDLPGPHPGLAPLLDAGFQITYVETFASTAEAPFFDARRYAGSGGSLL